MSDMRAQRQTYISGVFAKFTDSREMVGPYPSISPGVKKIISLKFFTQIGITYKYARNLFHCRVFPPNVLSADQICCINLYHVV